jgi:membrane-bound metal-dependent hydrolase YbcI (DUF457 family)
VDNLTHTLFAATLARTRLERTGRGTTAALLIASNAPDIDVLASTGGAVDYLHWHRGPTHGLLGVIGLGVATAALVYAGRFLLDRRRAREHARPDATFVQLVLVSMLAVFLHVLMDFPTSYGSRSLSPFDWHWYGLDLMPIVDIYLLFVLATTLAFGWRSPEARRRNAAIALVFMAGDYGLRAAAHHEALAQAPALFGASLAGPCDPREPRAGPIDWWPRGWSTTATPGSSRRCLADLAAIPDFLSPFRWRIIARFSNTYESVDVDLLHPRPPEASRRLARRIPDVWTPEAVAAASADLPRVFLGFSRFPAVRTLRQPDGTTTVRWIDVRFADGLPRRSRDPRGTSLFTITVRLDRDGRVVDQHFGS